MDSDPHVNKFNDFFTGIGQSLAATIPESNTPFEIFLKNSPLIHLLWSQLLLITISNTLNITLCTGSDGIDLHLAIPAVYIVTPVLAGIIYYLFSTDSIKLAKVMPSF